MTCHCEGRGLIKIEYHTGEPFDVAICRCDRGATFRAMDAAVLGRALQLAPENRVAWLEDFAETPHELTRDVVSAHIEQVERFLEAGRTKAKFR